MKQIITSIALMATAVVASAAPIYEAPEGETRLYSRSAAYYYIGNADAVYYGTDTGYAAEIVFCENGDVYIKNPVTGLYSDTYIKGTLSDNEILVEFPQEIYVGTETGEEIVYSANRLEFKAFNDGTGVYTNYVPVAPEDNKLRFFIDPETGVIDMDGTSINVDEVPQYILGVTNDTANGVAWSYYGDGSQQYVPFTDTVTSLPETLQDSVKEWEMTYWMNMNKYNQDTKLLSIAVDEATGDVFIGNLYDSATAENYVKGTLENGAIIVPSGQYLGVDQRSHHHMYVMGCIVERVPEMVNEVEILKPVLKFEDALSLECDLEAGQIFSADMVIDINQGNELPSALKIYVEPTIIALPDTEPSNPVAPTWDSIYIENDPEVNYTSIWLFYIPKKDVNGRPLNPDNMYYNLYVDDELYGLYAADYPMVNPLEDLFNIPYNFDNDFNVRVNGELHQVIVYFRDGFNDVAIESVYVCPDGTELRSARASMADVKEIDYDTPVATEYFDIAGRQVKNPGQGIFIKIERFADGNTKTSKIRIR